MRAFRDAEANRRVRLIPAQTPQAARTRRRHERPQRRHDLAFEVRIVDPEKRGRGVHSTDGEGRTRQRHQKQPTCRQEVFPRRVLSL